MPTSDPSDLSVSLDQSRQGDRVATDRVSSAVYEELRRLAGALLAAQRPGHTLQPTALVNEAYLRLVDQRAGYESRQHFLSLAATVMRRVLGDHARRRMTRKRGDAGERVSVELDFVAADGESARPPDLIDLDDAMTRLEELHSRQARILELRYLAGMTIPEVAAELGVSKSTVEAEWRAARAWLRRELSTPQES